MALLKVSPATAGTIDRFIISQKVEEGKSELTARNYRMWLKPYLSWLDGRDALSAGPEDVAAYLAAVWAEHENPHTRFSRVKAIKVFYKWATRKGLVASNPAADVRTPRTPMQVPRVIGYDIVEALRRVCGMGTFTGKRDRALLEVAFDCGLRSVELRRLRIPDIDWRERTLRVEGKASDGGAPPVRHVPFATVVTRTLRKYLDARQMLPGDLLFVDRQGLPLTRRSFARIIERLRARARISGVRASWHSMRHAFVTEMLRSGCDEEHLRRMAGWRDRQMLQRYAHLVTADLRRAHDRHSPADRLLRGD